MSFIQKYYFGLEEIGIERAFSSFYFFKQKIYGYRNISAHSICLYSGISLHISTFKYWIRTYFSHYGGDYLFTKEEIYHQMAKFWTKIFALIFGIGVATGIVMEFEFGTNWATYSKYVGDIFGSALAAEGIFAFALESGFLGVLLFGWNRVSPGVHFFSTLMVFLGSMFSAVWIVVANSWQQTPAGYHIVGEGIKARRKLPTFGRWYLIHLVWSD